MKTLLLDSLMPLAFVVLGLFLMSGRGAGLIAGYNTLPPSKRRTIDKRALCRFTGKMMFYVAGCLLFILVGDRIASKALFVVGLVLLFVGVVFMLVYANTGHRFERK